MVSRFRLAGLLGGVAAAFVLAAVGCEKVPLMAPSGSTITLTTATSALGLNGTAEIGAQVIEAAGTPPHSGTHVTFLTSLGTMEPSEVQTDASGRAVSTFKAGTTSGVATITATSGGTSSPAAGALKIAVGSAAVGGVVAAANPAVVSSTGGSSTISAKVTDTGGNALASIPVTFSTDQGSVSPPVANTDASGTATAVLTTTKTAKVTVTSGIATTTVGSDGKPVTSTPATSSVTVTVNTTASITVGTATPASPAAGSAVAFSLTYGTGGTTGASPITRLTVDWGDGATSNFSGAPASISHVYNNPGGYLVVVTGFDALGDTSTGTSSVTVTPRPRVAVSLTYTPAAPVSKTPVTFTITSTPTTGNTIVSVTVNFGDGNQVTLAGNTTTVQHVFSAPGTYQVSATSTDSSGASGSAVAILVVQ